MLFTTTLLIARNQRILARLEHPQAENQRRAAKGSPRNPETATQNLAALATARPP